VGFECFDGIHGALFCSGSIFVIFRQLSGARPDCQLADREGFRTEYAYS
jgi:hypothetical protein